MSPDECVFCELLNGHTEATWVARRSGAAAFLPLADGRLPRRTFSSFPMSMLSASRTRHLRRSRLSSSLLKRLLKRWRRQSELQASTSSMPAGKVQTSPLLISTYTSSHAGAAMDWKLGQRRFPSMFLKITTGSARFAQPWMPDDSTLNRSGHNPHGSHATVETVR